MLTSSPRITMRSITTLGQTGAGYLPGKANLMVSIATVLLLCKKIPSIWSNIFFFESVGLYTDKEASFLEDEDGIARDLVSPGTQNVYICEVGSAHLNGTFQQFKDVLMGSQVVLLLVFDHCSGSRTRKLD